MVVCQLVVGPAGVGKSTYCKILQDHCAAMRRRVHVANLDPAAENFEYDVAFDVRELISVADAMDELQLGPNGALVYCMEHLLDNMSWLQDKLEEYDDDDYVIFDCPGQVELYSHIPVMRRVADQLKMWNTPVVVAYLLDATFITDPGKFISGCLLSLSAMVQLELPHINVMTKCDLADKHEIERFLDLESGASLLALHHRQRYGDDGEDLDMWAAQPTNSVEPESEGDPKEERGEEGGEQMHGRGRPPRQLARLERLTQSISTVVDDYMMVSFLPLDVTDEDSVGLVLQHTDHAVQYGENMEPREPKETDIELDDGCVS